MHQKRPGAYKRSDFTTLYRNVGFVGQVYDVGIIAPTKTGQLYLRSNDTSSGIIHGMSAKRLEVHGRPRVSSLMTALRVSTQHPFCHHLNKLDDLNASNDPGRSCKLDASSSVAFADHTREQLVGRRVYYGE